MAARVLNFEEPLRVALSHAFDSERERETERARESEGSEIDDVFRRCRFDDIELEQRV